jgi:hypothetical protein
MEFLGLVVFCNTHRLSWQYCMPVCLTFSFCLISPPTHLTETQDLDLNSFHDIEFGYMDSAQMAAQEAIRVAQQYHDGACVAYAMGCMPLHQHSFTVDEGISDYRDTLHRCVKRSILNRLYHLASGTALSLAQQRCDYNCSV